MSDVLILGTMALDTLETPFGKADDALGGSASFASYAASFFVKPHVLSVIGKDFPEKYLTLLKDKGVNLDHVTVSDKTFRWTGFYEYDMNEAHTKNTELNSLAHFSVSVPNELKKCEYVYLANIDPELQSSAIDQLDDPKLIVMDTMNFWISSKKDALINTIGKCHVLILNEGEARQLFDTPNLIIAAHKALELGPRCVVVKKGEHGALMFMDGKHFSAPSYPLETVKDPTGCGDCFGGAFTGFLAQSGDFSEKNVRKAIVYGSVIASHNAEDFSLNTLSSIEQSDINARFDYLKDIREF